jgi:hypothetical protein
MDEDLLDFPFGLAIYLTLTSIEFWAKDMG